MRHDPTQTILVTGASSGIGAEVAQRLADPCTHVIVNYREDAHRAAAVVAAIRRAGGHASTLAADICDESDTAAMIESVTTRFGRLDALILTASGDVAPGADPGYAMRRNRDAQRRLALLSMPLMPAGGHILFVTNHQAHFFPHKAVPKGYAAMAASKRAGETALYALRSEIAGAGIHLTVVSGDVHDEGDLHDERDLHDETAAAHTEFATAITDAARNPSPSCMVYVGGAHYLMTA